MQLSIASRYFSLKNPTNVMPGESLLVLCHCRRILLDAVQWRDTLVDVMLIATLIRFVTMSLIDENKNNGDKFYRRKSMGVANEKLIINELGSNLQTPY